MLKYNIAVPEKETKSHMLALGMRLDQICFGDYSIDFNFDNLTMIQWGGILEIRVKSKLTRIDIEKQEHKKKGSATLGLLGLDVKQVYEEAKDHILLEFNNGIELALYFLSNHEMESGTITSGITGKFHVY